MKSFFGEKDGGEPMKGKSADDVFKTGKGVCDGYSSVFCDLAAKVGLKCEKISGYSKAFGYVPGQKLTKTDHA